MNILDEILEEQKAYFLSGETLDIDFRIEKLKILKNAIINNKEKISKALFQDLRKSEFEAYATEILPVFFELENAIKNLKTWAKKEVVSTPFPFNDFIPAILDKLTGGIINSDGDIESFILKEPYGNVLIISPFNYPFQLSIMPAIGAIAAGNTIIIKPASSTPNTTKILTEIINSIFPSEFARVLNPKNTFHFDLLNKKFDYIFFTGSTTTGKKIMEAAAKNLTPITLELGGKSPSIVDKNCNLKNAAKSIVRGKLTNAGQTCVAPDYAVVQREIREDFIKELINEIKAYLGPTPQESKDFGRIINEEQFRKLDEIIKSERENIIYGGETDECGLYIAPTLINASFESFSMQNEIFGPILPVIEYENFFDLIKILKTKEKPLAAYLFSENEEYIEEFLKNFSFGGGCINETLIHLMNNNLPFGGIGLSGLGEYHGKFSFETFSHKKGVVKKKGGKNLKFLSPENNIEKIKRMVR